MPRKRSEEHDVYKFPDVSTARTAFVIMMHWGVAARRHEDKIIRDPGGKSGFDLFARLYDGVPVQNVEV